MWSFFLGSEKCSKMDCDYGCTTLNIQPIESYILNGWIVYYMNHNSKSSLESRDKQRSIINYLNFHFKNPEKKRKVKSELTRRKEIIIMKIEVNERNLKNVKTTNETERRLL